MMLLLQRCWTWKTCYSPVFYSDATIPFVTELLNMKNMLHYCGLPWCCCYICYRDIEHKKHVVLQSCGLPWCCCYICYRAIQHEKHVTLLWSTLMLLLHLLQSCSTWKTRYSTVVYHDAAVTFVTELWNTRNLTVLWWTRAVGECVQVWEGQSVALVLHPTPDLFTVTVLDQESHFRTIIFFFLFFL